MGLSWAGVTRFAQSVFQLQSFPIFCAYLLLILFSKTWQQNTKPLTLRWVLVVYNFSCSLISLYTLCGFVYGLYRADMIYQKSPTPELAHFFTVYWLTKHLELLDTVFMVLRHRRRQISFLHVYHHASMLVLSDYCCHLAAWPAIAVILGLNALVHVALYFYYGLTAFNPHRQLSWKRRLTEMQIGQFVIDLVYAARGYTHHSFCAYGFIYGLVMILLFSNFYYRAYIRVRPSPQPLPSSKITLAPKRKGLDYVNGKGKQE